MKALKYVLFSVIGIVAILLITGLFLSKEAHYERSIVINAPLELINKQISSLENMNSWSPWNEYDPQMKITYTGKDGQVGSVFHWEGNEDVGKGSQEITLISDTKIETKVIFIEPWSSEMKAIFTLEPEASGVKVTWASDGTNPYPFNVFCLFMNMDEMIGKDFEKGLNNLKEKAENLNKEQRTYNGYTIKEITLEPRVYLAKKGNISFDKIEGFYLENLPAIMESVNKAGVELSGAPCGLFYRWDTETNSAEMAAAMPVIENEKISTIKKFERIDVGGGKTLHIAFYGSYEKTEAAHNAMDEYMVEKGLHLNGEVIEEYVTDPSTEPDPSKWLTNIYYVVK
ncbi:MAG: SRPBCC family protein [Bacteroidetes bacterium]|nr:SRPBCC family protein [Bacteroidota bacterium]HET6243722.1 SRPBCC family protein [Bacteroidia bacterium]